MQTIVETLLNGLMLGALYALFGLGLNLSLGVMRMINVAQGDLIVLGAYRCSVVVVGLHVSSFTALFAVVPVMFGIGWVLQRVLRNRVVGRGPLSPLLLTFGLSTVCRTCSRSSSWPIREASPPGRSPAWDSMSAVSRSACYP